MLQFGNFGISSEERSQQDDPLGGLIFLPGHTSNLTFFCLSHYDGFHGLRFTCGPLSTVFSDVDIFRGEGAKIRLQLNVGKCEIIFKAR